MFSIPRLLRQKDFRPHPTYLRPRRLTLILFAILLSSCATEALDRRNAEPQPAYVPPRGTAYVSLEFTGQLLVTAPLWLGAERGEHPHIYLSATPEQVTNLREQYRWIAVGIGGVKDPSRLPNWEKMAWDLEADPFQRSARLYPPSNNPATWEGLFPIHVVGVDRSGKSTIILAVPLR
jgi:hypothetical protein